MPNPDSNKQSARDQATRQEKREEEETTPGAGENQAGFLKHKDLAGGSGAISDAPDASER